MKYGGEDVYLLICEGEILDVSYDEDELGRKAYQYNEENTDSEIEDCGYDVEELSDDERSQFEFMAGCNGGFNYVHYLHIPDDDEIEEAFEEALEENEYAEKITDETEFETDHFDKFKYYEVIEMIDHINNN